MAKVYFEMSDPSSRGIVQINAPIFYHEETVAQSRYLTLRHFPWSTMRQGGARPKSADSLKNRSLRYKLLPRSARRRNWFFLFVSSLPEP